MSQLKTTVRKDGSVRVWNVYSQSWLETTAADLLSDRRSGHAIMASLSEAERKRIERAAAKG